MLSLDNRHDFIKYFADVIEAKDPYTQGHSHHVYVIVDVLVDRLPMVGLRERIDKEKLLTAALLHDIGKIKTPTDILNKDGALDEDEWRVMRSHPLVGKQLLENTVLADIGDWILYHHERIDGRGYYGLRGQDIPLESRIIAIADTFSALRTYRVYRPALSIADTVRIMREAAGTQLDGELLEYFLGIDERVLENLECNCEACRLRREALERESGDGKLGGFGK